MVEAESNSSAPYQVLIAHQSSIPSYRVRFYDLLEQIRPPEWEFKVVSTLPADSLNCAFPVVMAPVKSIAFSRFQLKWQNFLSEARRADVLVFDTLLSNVAYPVSAMLRKRNSKLVFWGHTSDLNQVASTVLKRYLEAKKRSYIARGDHFLAYTASEAKRAVDNGFNPATVTVLNNTIDVASHRRCFQQMKQSRFNFRAQLGFKKEAKVMLVLGRLIRHRRIEFVLDAFDRLSKAGNWQLAIVGDGPELDKVRQLETRLGKDMVKVLGNLTDMQKKAEIYLASDVFVMPGMVGLAPLEAICYDLPVIALDLNFHSPEFDYLNQYNSVVLPGRTTPDEFADFLADWIKTPTAERFAADRFHSIEHLTLEAMACKFSSAITGLLTAP